MFKGILLATDGSDHAVRAAEIAADLAATYGARLTLVSVSPRSLTVDEVESSPRAGRFPDEVKEEIRNLRDMLVQAAAASESIYAGVPAPTSALLAMANDIIDQAEHIAKKKDVKKISRAALIGDAADNILEQADKATANLIVMGTRGLSNFSGLIMGSVSHRVIHLAKCPCLTVK